MGGKLKREGIYIYTHTYIYIWLYIYIYMADSHFLNGRNKPTQHCKAIIFQLKKEWAYSMSLTAEGIFTYYLTQSTCQPQEVNLFCR